MLRLISLILLLAGAAVAALGGWLYMGKELPAGLLGSNEAVIERKVLEPEAAPAPAEASVEIAAAPPPPPPPPAPVEAAEEAFEEAGDDGVTFEAVEPVDIEDVLSSKKGETSRTRSLSAPDAAEPPVEAALPEPVMAPTSAPEPEAASDELIFSTATMDPRTIEPAAEAAPLPAPSLEEQLYTVPIAYETPASASFGQSFNVVLSINAQEGATTAADVLPGTGNVIEAEADVTDRVEAALYGEAFKIELQTPKRLKLSKRKESLWRWKVTPIKSGPQDLTFDLYAIDVNDEAESVLTFNDTVTVEVSYVGQAMFLAQKYDPLVMLIAGFGSLLAGLFGVARFFRGS